MTEDTSYVQDHEILLRRIPGLDPAKFLYPDGPVDLRAFLPTDADVDGISLYRESIVTPQQILDSSSNERIRLYAGIVALLASSIRAVPIIISPENTLPGDLPGHVSLPEINSVTYKKDKVSKQAIKVLADKLVRACIDIRIKPTLVVIQA